MEITKEMLNSYEMQIKAEIDKEEIQKKYNEKYDYLQKNVELKGFRKGKAPIALIKMKLDEAFTKEFSNELAEGYINDYVKENKIEKLSRFELKESELEEGRPFRFTAVFQVRPELNIEDSIYKGIKLVKRDDTPSEEELSHILEGYRAQKAIIKPFDGPVDSDTIIYGDLVVSSVDSPDKTETQNDFSVARGTFVIGEAIFEDLIGKKAGDVFEKELELSAAFLSFSANEKVSVKYTLKSLKKQELPALDDNLAKQIDENTKTIQELKDKIKKDVETRKKEQNRQRMLNDIDSHLTEKLDFTPPPALVEFELYKLLNHYQAQMARYNIGFNSEEERESFIEKRKDDAARLAKIKLILDHIIEKEAIDVEFKDVKDRINEIVKDRENASELRKEYLKDENFKFIKDGLVRDKLYDFIIENAEFTEGETEEKPAEKPADK